MSGSSRFSNEAQIEKDISNIGKKLIKGKLFDKVKFIYDDSDLKKGGALHKHYLKHVDNVISHPEDASTDEKMDYNNHLWTMMTMDKYYTKCLSSKRTAVYSSMFQKFRGEYRFRFWVFENVL